MFWEMKMCSTYLTCRCPWCGIQGHIWTPCQEHALKMLESNGFFAHLVKENITWQKRKYSIKFRRSINDKTRWFCLSKRWRIFFLSLLTSSHLHARMCNNLKMFYSFFLSFFLSFFFKPNPTQVKRRADNMIHKGNDSHPKCVCLLWDVGVFEAHRETSLY